MPNDPKHWSLAQHAKYRQLDKPRYYSTQREKKLIKNMTNPEAVFCKVCNQPDADKTGICNYCRTVDEKYR